MTTLKKLKEATFQKTKTGTQLNPKPAKTASQEYQKKASKGIHKAQPLPMFDAGHTVKEDAHRISVTISDPNHSSVSRGKTNSKRLSELKVIKLMQKNEPRSKIKKFHE